MGMSHVGKLVGLILWRWELRVVGYPERSCARLVLVFLGREASVLLIIGAGPLTTLLFACFRMEAVYQSVCSVLMPYS